MRSGVFTSRDLLRWKIQVLTIPYSLYIPVQSSKKEIIFAYLPYLEFDDKNVEASILMFLNMLCILFAFSFIFVFQFPLQLLLNSLILLVMIDFSPLNIRFIYYLLPLLINLSIGVSYDQVKNSPFKKRFLKWHYSFQYQYSVYSVT